MFCTLEVFKLLISKDSNDLHWLNILSIFITDDVSKLLKSNDFRE